MGKVADGGSCLSYAKAAETRVRCEYSVCFLSNEDLCLEWETIFDRICLT